MAYELTTHEKLWGNPPILPCFTYIVLLQYIIVTSLPFFMGEFGRIEFTGLLKLNICVRLKRDPKTPDTVALFRGDFLFVQHFRKLICRNTEPSILVAGIPEAKSLMDIRRGDRSFVVLNAFMARLTDAPFAKELGEIILIRALVLRPSVYFFRDLQPPIFEVFYGPPDHPGEDALPLLLQFFVKILVGLTLVGLRRIGVVDEGQVPLEDERAAKRPHRRPSPSAVRSWS